MANQQELPIQNLDLSDIEERLKEFMNVQDEFKDHNFEASALNVLIKLLAYNTYQNNVVANITFSEKFLDSANLRNSVVSKAKELGYTPQSTIASKFLADITVVEGNTELSSSVLLEKGSTFQAKNENGQSISFITTKSYSADKSGSTFFFPDVEIVQGSYGIVDFVRDKTQVKQRFVLPQNNIDTNYLEVYIQEGSDNTSFVKYERANNALSANASSQIYYLQEAHDGYFEIYFGEDLVGKDVGHGKIIRVIYLSTLGADGNGFSQLTFNKTPNTNEINQGIFTVTPQFASAGGKTYETIESIRFRAPKFYASQFRAFTSDDYINIILSKFSDIKSAAVWGGEDIENKDYGKVFVALNNVSSTPIVESRKEEILYELKNNKLIGITPVLVDPDFIYIDVTCNVYIQNGVTSLSGNDIRKNVETAITNYSSVYLEQFNKDFEHSQLSRLIDDSNFLIDNNDTQFKIYSKFELPYLTYTTFNYTFNNELVEKSISSTEFVHKEVLGYILDDGLGNLKFYKSSDDSFVSNVGTVVYTTGKIRLVDLLSSTDEFTLYANTKGLNVFAEKNKIIKIVNKIINLKN